MKFVRTAKRKKKKSTRLTQRYALIVGWTERVQNYRMNEIGKKLKESSKFASLD
ncbi:MAG TPA: hypothetical protein VJP58_09475 [Candidatus Nitrosocosmicus sp.]|nr:hypothetical protein [Candidatus Nitrosocosmicus sp.]